MLSEEPASGPEAHPLILDGAAQHVMRRREGIQQADRALDARDAEVVFDDGHRPITARAAANSAAKVSGARCTYCAVVSGEA